MAISKRLRFEILRRDEFRCRYCGATPEQQELRVDHVVPVALGGTDEPGNLVTACDPCNTGKSSVPLDGPIIAAISDDALRWANALAVAADRRYTVYEQDQERRRFFLDRWEKWSTGPEWNPKPIPLPDGWWQSVARFYAAGLESFDIDELVDIAMSGPSKPADTWRYFCGCAWKRIQKSQDSAREIVREQEQHQPEPRIDGVPTSVGQILQELSNHA